MEIVTAVGPLEPRRLGWVAELYGRVDEKYRRDEFLSHLFTRSPAGAGLHAFALDGDRPVAHCAVVPLRGRRGSAELRCGKLEALFVEEAYRGRRGSAQPVVLSLLERLYDLADAEGIALVHAHVTPRVGHVTGFQPLEGLGERTLVAVLRSRTAAERAVAGAQRLVRSPLGRRVEARLRPATDDDADLVAAPPPSDGHWTVLAEDAWTWYRSSPVVRVVEVSGSHGSRALVQVPGSPRDPLRIVGWRAESRGLRPALRLLAAAARAAEPRHATSLRFQPWSSSAGDGDLRHACQLLGFVPRPDLTTLWVRAHDPALARVEAVVPTPMLYLGF